MHTTLHACTSSCRLCISYCVGSGCVLLRVCTNGWLRPPARTIVKDEFLNFYVQCLCTDEAVQAYEQKVQVRFDSGKMKLVEPKHEE
eukprot:COSAG06_NODE_980_length_11224_cov_324.998382_13_plen_87_part_00